MNDPLLNAIEKERRTLQARLAVLDQMEAKLRGKPVPLTARGGDRAPAGALREAIIAALRREKHPILSKALKAKVVAAGFPSRINGQYFTITLRNLSDEGVVVKNPRGSYSTYRINRH